MRIVDQQTTTVPRILASWRRHPGLFLLSSLIPALAVAGVLLLLIEAADEGVRPEVVALTIFVLLALFGLGITVVWLERGANHLARMDRQLTDAMQYREQLFASLAHDMATPVTVILSEGEIGLRHPSVDSTERFTAIHRAARRLRRMVEDLQETTGGREDHLDITRFDLVELLHHLCLDEANEENPIRFTASTDRLEGAWDQFKLERVFDNLIRNGMKYSQPGNAVEVRIGVERSDPPVARVDIVDSGIGIPQQELSRVFSPFFRASNVGARPGLGLGLSSAQLVVAKHGGTIEVMSREGVGTTMVVRLPLAPGNVAPDPTTPLEGDTLRDSRAALRAEAAPHGARFDARRCWRAASPISVSVST